VCLAQYTSGLTVEVTATVSADGTSYITHADATPGYNPLPSGTS
jgi:hypothetical protein